MYDNTADSKYNYINICCSFSAYNYILNFDFDTNNIYGCLNDLSYGNLNFDKFTFMNCDHVILLKDMIAKVNANTKVRILFNSNNSCEYCNLLYMIRYFHNYDVTLIDSGKSIETTFGLLTIKSSNMIPIDMIDKCMKSNFSLTEELLYKYQKEWDEIFSKNADLRYINNRTLYSVEESYFDKIINNQNIFTIMDDYGLSEKWLMDRYDYPSRNNISKETD